MADTQTTNLGLVKPELNTPDWGAKLNENFDKIDAAAAAAGGGGTSIPHQTVLNGPLTADGLADALSSSGLTVGVKNALLGSFSKGVESNPDVAQIPGPANALWTLPANKTSYLYVERDSEGNLTYGSQLVRPTYSALAPAAPTMPNSDFTATPYNNGWSYYNDANPSAPNSQDGLRIVGHARTTTDRGTAWLASPAFVMGAAGFSITYKIGMYSNHYGTTYFEYRLEILDAVSNAVLESVVLGQPRPWISSGQSWTWVSNWMNYDFVPQPSTVGRAVKARIIDVNATGWESCTATFDVWIDHITLNGVGEDSMSWFDTNQYRMYKFVAPGWEECQRLFVGEATTDGSSVTSLRSYAYNGKAVITQLGAASRTTYVKNHNLGLLPGNVSLFGATAAGGALYETQYWASAGVTYGNMTENTVSIFAHAAPNVISAPEASTALAQLKLVVDRGW